MALEAARWRFARMSPSQVNQDPVQGEFFTAAADLPDRLVREAIQNSLDARRGDSTVRVRFAFSGQQNALPPQLARRYLDGLARHIGAVASADATAGGAEAAAMSAALECLDGPMTYLTVGDSGTTGLLGVVDANREREAGNDFWGFFRSVGISPKGEDSGGSWGLGKWVFPDASSINAYLGVTRRDGEDRDLLMGMAMLKTHHVGDGMKYPPYGYFAAASGADDDEWLPLPVESGGSSNGLVAKAIEDFSLDRRLEGPGLSVVVPYPRETAEGDDEAALTPATIARAVVIQYFLPIVRGHLEVEIVKPGERRREISAETIEGELGHIAPPRRDDNSLPALRGAIRLARWADALEDDQHIEMPAPRSGSDLDDLDLSTLRERYDQRERLAFRLTLNARRRDPDTTIPVDFRLYLERDDDLPKGHDYFVRGQLRIPGMDHVGSHKARALVLVEGESELGHLLRDAEGPAHATWDPQAQRLKDRWIGGYDRVRRVRRAALLMLQRLVERPEERQFDALADLFPSDLAAERGRSRTRRAGTESEDSSKPTPSLRSRRSLVSLADIGGGFSFRASPGATGIADSLWDLRFAYDVVRGGKGRAFRQFEQGLKQRAPDFSVRNGLAVEHDDGCEYEVVSDNALRVGVLRDDFRLTVTGFDERDVLVEAVEARPDQGSNADDTEQAE